jgi:hypothetical protein
MPEVLVSTDDLTVLGGPATINLELDFGPTGARGSKIFSTNQNPNSSGALGSQIPVIGDWAINVSQNDAEYSYMYEYVAITNSTSQWQQRLKLDPGVYAENRSVTFTDGSATILLSLNNVLKLTTTTPITSSNFNVQHSVLNTKPVSSAISVGTTSLQNEILTLPITIKAMEYTGGTWLNLEGSKVVHLFISVV